MAIVTKPQTNFILDMAQIALGILVLTSGLVLWLTPTGDGEGHQGGYNDDYYDNYDEESFLVTRSTWKDLHLVATLSLAVLVALHVILHLNWIQTMFGKMFH